MLGNRDSNSDNIVALVLPPQEYSFAQVIIMDELGDGHDVAAARKAIQEGVSLVATAHAISMHSLVHNPALNSLIGGLQSFVKADAPTRCAPFNIVFSLALETCANLHFGVCLLDATAALCRCKQMKDE